MAVLQSIKITKRLSSLNFVVVALPRQNLTESNTLKSFDAITLSVFKTNLDEN